MTPIDQPGLDKLKKATDDGLLTKDIQEAKTVLNDKESRDAYMNYLKDPQNQQKLKECVGPSLQAILDDPNTDAETRQATEKLMADLGLVKPNENRTAASDKKPDSDTDKKDDDGKEKKKEKVPVVVDDKAAQDMQSAINTDPTLSENTDQNNAFQNLKTALEKQPQDLVEIWVALKAAWEYVRTIFFGNNLNQKTALGFVDFDKVQDQIHDILSKNPTKADIQKTLENLQKLIENEDGLKKKLGYVYGSSRLQDQLSLTDKPQQSTYELLAGHLHVGDVLLLNKEKPGIGGNMLNNLSPNDVDATHTVVITNESPLQFSHAGERLSGGVWVEYNADLKDYLKKYPSDVMVMQTSAALKENAKKYIDAKTGEQDQKNGKYDYLSAVWWVLNPAEAAKNNQYNCVQYVARVLGMNDKNYTIPNEFLSLTQDKMKPTYMTTLATADSFTSADVMQTIKTKQKTEQPAAQPDDKPKEKTS